MKIDIESFIRRTGIRQNRLAEIAGVSPSMIHALKNGTTDTSASVCRKLLLAGMTLGELFGPEVERAVNSTSDGKNGPCAPYPDEICRLIVSRGVEALKKEGKIP